MKRFLILLTMTLAMMFSCQTVNEDNDSNNSGNNTTQEGGDDPVIIDTDFELITYSKVKIDYDYIVSLIQNIVLSIDDADETEESRQKKINEIKEYIQELQKDNIKLGNLMMQLLDNIIADKNAYKGQNISIILEEMKREAIELVVSNFVGKWFVDKDAVIYAVEFHRKGEIPNENVLKASIDYSTYQNSIENPLPKFKCLSAMISELKEIIKEEIIPLQQR